MSNVNIIFGDYEPSERKEEEPEYPKKEKEHYFFVHVEDIVYNGEKYACHVVNYSEKNTYGVFIPGYDIRYEDHRFCIHKLTSIYLDGNGVPIKATFKKSQWDLKLKFQNGILDNLLKTNYVFEKENIRTLKNSEMKNVNIAEEIFNYNRYAGTQQVRFELWDDFRGILDTMGKFTRENPMTYPYYANLEEHQHNQKMVQIMKTLAAFTPGASYIAMADDVVRSLNAIFDLNIPIYENKVDHYGPVQFGEYQIDYFKGGHRNTVERGEFYEYSKVDFDTFYNEL
ncbi:MAG: hypothetical protein OIF50_07940 [Flavobacteriaceae bacterium]|nr:hypothetical protein [Flavobacteriaceae bacterium]